MTYVKRIFGIVLIIFLIVGIWSFNWIEFFGKSLWDWLELLVVPASLAFLFWTLENREDKVSREISIDQFRENLLNEYFNTMGRLENQGYFNLTQADENSGIKPQPSENIGWFRTVSITQHLDPKRKRLVLEFLYYSNLLFHHGYHINLLGSNFSNGDYERIFLNSTNLCEVNFENSNFYKAHLDNALFRASNLKNTDFRQSTLIGADFSGADLSGAKFDDAFIPNTNFSNLTDLTNVSFNNASIQRCNFFNSLLDENQLKNAKSLAGTLLPDGSLYDGRYNLENDIIAAESFGYSPNDPISIGKWYKEAREVLDGFWPF